MIRLRAGRSCVLLLVAAREFFFVSLPIQSWWAVELTAHLFLVSRLRVSGAVCLLPLHAFMSFTGTALSVFYYGGIICLWNPNFTYSDFVGYNLKISYLRRADNRWLIVIKLKAKNTHTHTHTHKYIYTVGAKKCVQILRKKKLY